MKLNLGARTENKAQYRALLECAKVFQKYDVRNQCNSCL